MQFYLALDTNKKERIMKRDTNTLTSLRDFHRNCIKNLRSYGTKIRNFHALIYSV